jgi:hypothetical protein
MSPAPAGKAEYGGFTLSLHLVYFSFDGAKVDTQCYNSHTVTLSFHYIVGK